MPENPYQVSGVNDDRPEPKPSNWPLILLGLACVLTLLFASINAWEEEIRGRAFAMVVGLSIVSQLPGLGIAQLFRLSPKSYTGVLLVGAYLIAATSLAVYTIYAFNGKSDSMNSAAHMHVIFFPIFHLVLSVFVYLCVGFGAFCIYLYRRQRDAKN